MQSILEYLQLIREFLASDNTVGWLVKSNYHTRNLGLQVECPLWGVEHRTAEQLVRPEELESSIKGFNLYKSQGIDLIFSLMIKHFGNKAKLALPQIFNLSQNTGKLFSTWKKSIIVLILKPVKMPQNAKNTVTFLNQYLLQIDRKNHREQIYDLASRKNLKKTNCHFPVLLCNF